MLVLFASFPVWMAIYDQQTICTRTPRWFAFAAAGLALFTPLLVHRHMIFSIIAAAGGNETALGTARQMAASVVAAIIAGFGYVALCQTSAGARRIGLAIILFLLALMQMLVMSRSALLAFIFTCPALWFLGKGAAQWRRLAVVIGCVLALIVFAGVWLNRDQTWLRCNPEDVRRDFGVRVLIWQGAAKIFAEHPLLGCGYGQESFRRHWPFSPPFPEELRIPPEVKSFAHAHNLWLHLLATRGIIGFAAFTWLWAALYSKIARQGGKAAAENLSATAAASSNESVFGISSTPFIALLALISMHIAGIFELPLQEYNEILAALPIGVGIAYVSWQTGGRHGK